MRTSKTIEFWVGVFVAIAMAALFFLAMKVSNLSDLDLNDSGYRVTAHFRNIGSLKVRAPVTVAGVTVGRVIDIAIDRNSHDAVVTMRIQAKYDNLPSDTTASVLTAGLLGEQYIGLKPGGAEDQLRDGDDIELTQSALVLEELISKFLFSKAAEGSNKPATE